MLTTIKPFQAADLYSILDSTPERHVWTALPPRYAEHLAACPSITCWADNGIVACGGVVPIWNGLAEGWVAAGPAIREHVVFFHRSTRRFLLEQASSLNLYRVQASVDETFTVARRWITRLGFEPETSMPLYGPSQRTHIQYVWFPYGR